jgi:membrane-associated phospholipid phosphatase
VRRTKLWRDANACPRRADPRTLERREPLEDMARIAAAIALLGGRRGRKAALEGAVSIGVTSAAVNILAKSIAARPRPDRAEQDLFSNRAVLMPGSSSFPSGHAASGFAFANAVGRHLPVLAIPVRLLAGAVAYSRSTSACITQGDVAVGGMLGSGIASIVASAGDRLEDRHRRIT